MAGTGRGGEDARRLEGELIRACEEEFGRPFVWREGLPASFGIKGDVLGGMVHVNRSLGQPDRVRVLAHELAHLADDRNPAERELVAEAAAMLVLDARGLAEAVPYWMPAHLDPVADLAAMRARLEGADPAVRARARGAAARLLRAAGA